jgi:large subunit ribosomal protein L4
MKAGALVSALTVKSANDAVLVVESMDAATGKTKYGVALLSNLGVTGKKVMVVIPNEATEAREKFVLSLRNIPRVTILPVTGVNVYDLLNSDKVVCVRQALSELEARVGEAVA